VRGSGAREAIDRIFNNLISNAVKYTPTGGHVKVSLECLDDQAHVQVEDTGIGIPKEAIGHCLRSSIALPTHACSSTMALG